MFHAATVVKNLSRVGIPAAIESENRVRVSERVHIESAQRAGLSVAMRNSDGVTFYRPVRSAFSDVLNDLSECGIGSFIA